ncbi:hypothetical protein JCM6882_007730 [Rhodosporidiobolus microsporus]
MESHTRKRVRSPASESSTADCASAPPATRARSTPLDSPSHASTPPAAPDSLTTLTLTDPPLTPDNLTFLSSLTSLTSLHLILDRCTNHSSAVNAVLSALPAPAQLKTLHLKCAANGKDLDLHRLRGLECLVLEGPVVLDGELLEAIEWGMPKLETLQIEEGVEFWVGDLLRLVGPDPDIEGGGAESSLEEEGDERDETSEDLPGRTTLKRLHLDFVYANFGYDHDDSDLECLSQRFDASWEQGRAKWPAFFNAEDAQAVLTAAAASGVEVTGGVVEAVEVEKAWERQSALREAMLKRDEKEVLKWCHGESWRHYAYHNDCDGSTTSSETSEEEEEEEEAERTEEDEEDEEGSEVEVKQEVKDEDP